MFTGFILSLRCLFCVSLYLPLCSTVFLSCVSVCVPVSLLTYVNLSGSSKTSISFSLIISIQLSRSLSLILSHSLAPNVALSRLKIFSSRCCCLRCCSSRPILRCAANFGLFCTICLTRRDTASTATGRYTWPRWMSCALALGMSRFCPVLLHVWFFLLTLSLSFMSLSFYSLIFMSPSVNIHASAHLSVCRGVSITLFVCYLSRYLSVP